MSATRPGRRLWKDAGVTPTIVKARSRMVTTLPIGRGTAAEAPLPVALADHRRRRRRGRVVVGRRQQAARERVEAERGVVLAGDEVRGDELFVTVDRDRHVGAPMRGRAGDGPRVIPEVLEQRIRHADRLPLEDARDLHQAARAPSPAASAASRR